MRLITRYIPADVKEDIKLAKVLPLTAIPWIAGFVTSSIVIAFFIPNVFVKVSLVLITSLVSFFVFAFDAPGYIRKLRKFYKDRKKIHSLDHYNNLQEYDTISKTKDKGEVLFMELGVDPWEVAPNDLKERRAQGFASTIMASLALGTEVSVFGQCAAEDTTQLENRLQALESTPDELQELEYNRIEYHYGLSKNATSTRYIVRYKKPEFAINVDKEDEIESVEEAALIDGVILGADLIEEYSSLQLTPGATLQRGKEPIMTKEMKSDGKNSRKRKFRKKDQKQS